jgi:DNA-binding FadR family transcriptional regulator
LDSFDLLDHSTVQLDRLDSDFLKYLAQYHIEPGDRLPPLSEIGENMGVSVGALREQLAVARGLGVVSARPRLGLRREPFDFSQAVLPAVLFSLATGESCFAQLSRLRRAIEVSFWDEAVVLLTSEDKVRLGQLVDEAWAKLRGDPIHIPNAEHCQLHLTIFSRLDNPFVQGLLVAYWDAYDASELTRFMGYRYWVDVWTYHEQIVDALCAGEFERGRRLLNEHFALLPARTERSNQ